jgi:hypothetical protein
MSLTCAGICAGSDCHTRVCRPPRPGRAAPGAPRGDSLREPGRVPRSRCCDRPRAGAGQVGRRRAGRVLLRARGAVRCGAAAVWLRRDPTAGARRTGRGAARAADPHGAGRAGGGSAMAGRRRIRVGIALADPVGRRAGRRAGSLEIPRRVRSAQSMAAPGAKRRGPGTRGERRVVLGEHDPCRTAGCYVAGSGAYRSTGVPSGSSTVAYRCPQNASNGFRWPW